MADCSVLASDCDSGIRPSYCWRAALLTGKYPARLHITDWIPGEGRTNEKLRVPDWTMHLPVEEHTLARAFKEADDLATKEPKRADALRRKLNIWREQVDAQHPTPNPDYRSAAKSGQASLQTRTGDTAFQDLD